MRRRIFPATVLILAAGLAACSDAVESPLAPSSTVDAAKADRSTRGLTPLLVGLNTAPTAAIRATLAEYGVVAEVLSQIDLVFMTARAQSVPDIEALPFVEYAEPDTEVSTGPLDAMLASDFEGGVGTWNLDAVNVTDYQQNPFDRRVLGQTGEGVYVGVLDTGLLHTWRLYFPEERIAEEYAAAFSGGWHPNAANPATPNVWEQDVEGHGTHVASTVIGYDFFGAAIEGVAPRATVIPVKVLGQNGSGWTSMVIQGILHIADLKDGELADRPVVINMSLAGGPSAARNAAIDYAIDQGVVVVASAGNYGANGMGYPGAYEPVISVASAGWGHVQVENGTITGIAGQWVNSSWWYSLDVPESVDQYYISSFSSRARGGQDLDVVAPGHWVLGPYAVNRGARVSYYYLSGTSMASPHVAGIVALMLEEDPSLTAGQIEDILENAATPLAPSTGHLALAPGPACCYFYSWGDDATGHGFITADAALGGISGGS